MIESQHINLRKIRFVALDIAGASHSHEQQEHVSEFTLTLLQRNYRVWLFNTDTEQDMESEDFEHPGLTLLRGQTPPTVAVMNTYPQLLGGAALWITDNAQMQTWLHSLDQPFLHRGEDAAAPGGLRIVRLSELASVLDPSGFVLEDVAETISRQWREHGQGPLVVGIGGPPRSGFEGFAVELRKRLQVAGMPLVELMDLSAFMNSSEVLLELGPTEGPWVSRDVVHWLTEDVLEPLRAGDRVYFEQPPAALPRDFSAHFPLFLTTESVVIVFAEQVFSPPLAKFIDLEILLEVSAQETTRRVYEISTGESFDPKFTEQYMSREGRVYDAYLTAHDVVERASIKVDANEETAFRFSKDSPQGVV